MTNFDNELSEFIDNFYKKSSDKLEDFRIECELDHIPIIRRETEAFIINLLKLSRPKNILEIGTGAGFSATIFAKCLNSIHGAEDFHITTLEMIDKRIEAAKSNFNKFGINDNIHIIPGDATESLNRLTEEMSSFDDGDKFDFVFIDCAKSRYKEFFINALKITSSGGVIVCDNVLLSGRTASDKFITKHRDKTSTLRMREFIDFLKESNNYRSSFTSSLFNIGDGIIVANVY
jgi:predicted O-methyltransferase YrrM